MNSTNSDGAPDLSYLDSTLGYRMKRALGGLYRGIYEALGDEGLKLVQFSVFSIAQDNPGIAQSDLAKVPALERPRLVPIIDTLEKLNLAKRRENPEDRRRRMIYLTPAGTPCINRFKAKYDAYQKWLREEMGNTAFDQLIEKLEWISENSLEYEQQERLRKDASDES